MNINLETIIAVGMILLYAWSRYATPPTVRFDTTWGKFLVGRVAYCSIFLGAFVVLTASPPLLQEVLKLVGRGNAVILEGERSVPLVAALLLVVFLSEIPILSRWDGVVRSYFHRVAAIPSERRRWIALLQSAALRPDEKARKSLEGRFEDQGLANDDILLKPGSSPRHLWTRLSFLIDRLENMKSHRKYSECLSSPEYRRLLEDYEKSRGKATAVLELVTADKGERAVTLLSREFAEQCKEHLKRVYEFISGLILKCELTERLRLECARGLGLAPPRLPKPPAIGFHESLWLLILILVLVFSLLSHLKPGLLLLIGFQYLAAALIAVGFVELRRQLAPGGHRRRALPPIGRYVAAGGLAFFVSACAAIAYRYVADSSTLADAIRSYLTSSWPWTLVSGALAVFLAFLMGNWLKSRPFGQWRQRLDLGGFFNPVDALTLGVFLGLFAGLVVRPILEGLPGVAPGRVPLFLPLALRTGTFGFMLGGVVPAICRSAGLRQARRAEAESSAFTAAPASA